MPEVKRLDAPDTQWSDPRGWGIDPIRAAGPGADISLGVHLVSLRPGTTPRGNHFHRDATEWLLIFGSPGKLIWRATAEGPLNEIDIAGDGPSLFEIPPLVEHAIINTSDSDLYIMAFYDLPDPVTEPCEVLTHFAGERGKGKGERLRD